MPDITQLPSFQAAPQSDEGDTTILGAAGRGALSTIPFGEQAYTGAESAVHGTPYESERQNFQKNIQTDIDTHPMARIAGQGAGIVAPALLTGGATAPESIGEAAGQGALVGSGFGAGNAIDTLSQKGSDALPEAVADVAMGAGLGVAGGAAGSKIGELLGKAAPALEEISNNKAVQAVHMGPKELSNMTPEEIQTLGANLKEMGIIQPNKSTQEMFNAAADKQEAFGKLIGQVGDQSNELGLKIDDPGMMTQPLAEKMTAYEDMTDPEALKALKTYKSAAATIQAVANKNEDGSLNWNDLQRLKQVYGNIAFKNGAVESQPAADVYFQLKRGLQSIADSAQDNPQLGDQYKQALVGYSKLNPVVEGLQSLLGKERSGEPTTHAFGMVGKLVGQLPGQQNPYINALTSLGLMGAGHPLWGIGAATATLNNPSAMSSLASTAAADIPKIASKLPVAGAQLASQALPSVPMHQNMGVTAPVHPTNIRASTISSKAIGTVPVDHPALAHWKPVFQKNAANAKGPGEIEKSNAVTDYTLSQRDPAYAEAKQKAVDGGVQ